MTGAPGFTLRKASGEFGADQRARDRLTRRLRAAAEQQLPRSHPEQQIGRQRRRRKHRLQRPSKTHRDRPPLPRPPTACDRMVSRAIALNSSPVMQRSRSARPFRFVPAPIWSAFRRHGHARAQLRASRPSAPSSWVSSHASHRVPRHRAARSPAGSGCRVAEPRTATAPVGCRRDVPARRHSRPRPILLPRARHAADHDRTGRPQHPAHRDCDCSTDASRLPAATVMPWSLRRSPNTSPFAFISQRRKLLVPQSTAT